MKACSGVPCNLPAAVVRGAGLIWLGLVWLGAGAGCSALGTATDIMLCVPLR